MCTERRRREARPGTGGSCKTTILMTSRQVKAGDLRDRLKHRSSCSTVEEDLAAATVMDGSALPRDRCSPQSQRYRRGTPAQRAIAVAISSLGTWQKFSLLQQLSLLSKVDLPWLRLALDDRSQRLSADQSRKAPRDESRKIGPDCGPCACAPRSGSGHLTPAAPGLLDPHARLYAQRSRPRGGKP